MEWDNDERRKLEHVMELFKGKRVTCYFCEIEGEYGKELSSLTVTEGPWSVLQGKTYVRNIAYTFQCKGIDACWRRQEGRRKS